MTYRGEFPRLFDRPVVLLLGVQHLWPPKQVIPDLGAKGCSKFFRIDCRKLLIENIM